MREGCKSKKAVNFQAERPIFRAIIGSGNEILRSQRLVQVQPCYYSLTDDVAKGVHIYELTRLAEPQSLNPIIMRSVASTRSAGLSLWVFEGGLHGFVWQ